MTAALKISLPGMTLVLSAEAVPAVEAALREYTRRRRGRDLAAEIEGFLAEHPSASTQEIQLGVRARATDVRRVLAGDRRFERVSPGLGRPVNAKCWGLSSETSPPVPANGTSGSEGRSNAEGSGPKGHGS